MTTTKKRTKRMKAPQIPAPATLAEAEGLLAEIGSDQRQVEALETRMNEQLARIKAEFEASAAPINEAIEARFASLQAWAEAHKQTLLDRSRKTAKIATGELGWRTSPPAVRITGVPAVLEALKQLRLKRFIRVKEEVDKEAIRKDPDAVKNVKGISITQQEEFWIKPFASEIERARSRKVS
jgi:phage host-nuclease inhibitor protein Gam